VRSDASGRTRIAAFSGYDGIPDDSLIYARCDAACDQLTSWTLEVFGLDPFDARWGLDLALDANGDPRFAFSVQGPGIPVALTEVHCAAPSCPGADPYVGGTVDAASALPALDVPASCPMVWSVGADVKTAMLPSGKQIFVYSTEVHSEPGNAGCDRIYDRYLVRVAIP
jgi:hypothetical protein